MFNGIKLKTFLNTPQEWHALVIGFCVGFCPWILKLLPSGTLHTLIKGEEHYYAVGIVPGVVALSLFLVELAKLIKEVLL